MSHASGGIPVLMYHALEDSMHPAGAKDAGEQLYILSRDMFYDQMKYLYQNGFTVLLLEELAQLQEWPEKGVIITFDDGHQSNYTIALPILEEFGFKAHFFITTGWLGTPFFLHPLQVQELAEKGMAIGSHGVTHFFFSDMEDKQMDEELEQSKLLLEECSSRNITSFSAPGGRIKTDVITIGKEIGYTLFCTSDFSLLTNSFFPERIPRLAVKSNTDMATFQKMVSGDAIFFSKQRLKDFMLSALKDILGNPVYEKLRGLFLHISGSE